MIQLEAKWKQLVVIAPFLHHLICDSAHQSMGQSALGPETWRWMGQYPKGLGYGQHIVVFMQRLQQDAGVMLQNKLLWRHVMAETSYATAPLLDDGKLCGKRFTAKGLKKAADPN